MSAQLHYGDLKFTYSKKATPGDNPRLLGLDRTLFNGHEEYEVLSLINGFLKAHNIDGNPLTKEHGLKVERMLQKKPGHIRSQEHVNDWVKKEWRSFV